MRRLLLDPLADALRLSALRMRATRRLQRRL